MRPASSGSLEKSNPGAMCAAQKATCSVSAKKLSGLRLERPLDDEPDRDFFRVAILISVPFQVSEEEWRVVSSPSGLPIVVVFIFYLLSNFGQLLNIGCLPHLVQFGISLLPDFKLGMYFDNQLH
jgi:hypothetical protein